MELGKFIPSGRCGERARQLRLPAVWSKALRRLEKSGNPGRPIAAKTTIVPPATGT